MFKLNINTCMHILLGQIIRKEEMFDYYVCIFQTANGYKYSLGAKDGHSDILGNICILPKMYLK